jgi:Na+/proline symporter
MSALAIYSWVFIVIYVGVMWFLGFVAMKRTKSEEEFATARQSYGPLVTALVVTATFASGATFMGLAGMSYGMGWSNVWYGLLYPFGGYMGVHGHGIFCQALAQYESSGCAHHGRVPWDSL